MNASGRFSGKDTNIFKVSIVEGGALISEKPTFILSRS